MFRNILHFFLAHVVLSQNDDCVPRELLQRKLCTAMAADAHVLQVKHMMRVRDHSLDPGDNSLYRIDIIKRMHRKKSYGKKSRMGLQYAFLSNAKSKTLARLCKKCVLQIPRECSTLERIRPGSVHFVIATWDDASKRLMAECKGITEWDSFTRFQRSRLLGEGYSCDVQACFKDCMDDTECSADYPSNACRLEREAITCYDKYAECKPNVDGSTDIWGIQEREFSYCQQLENPFPVLVDLSVGSRNDTNVTSLP